MTTPVPQRPPWSVRAVRWVPPATLLIIPFLAVSTVVLPQLLRDRPRPVPEDLCALVPGDLLAQVVPAAGERKARVTSATAYADRARCEVATDRKQATTSATGSLYIEMESYGGRTFQDSEDHTQDNFARTKRRMLDGKAGVTTYRMADLRKLGDSAYVAVEQPSSGYPDRYARVTVAVLAGDMELTVSYSAGPSTDELATSAAVAVARALLRELR